MTYVRGCLSGLASLFLAGFIFIYVSTFQGQTKAIGLGALSTEIIESVFSPLFWLLAILFFAVFFATGRLRSTIFRVLLFWLPAIGITSLGLGLFGWFAVLMMRIRRS